MALKLFASCASILLCMLLPEYGLAQSLRMFRTRNGVRLRDLTGPQGRLELASKNAWFGDGYSVSWSPVCDTGFFSDSDALVMCKMLNYTYGRKYFNPSIAYIKYNTDQIFIGRVLCKERYFKPPVPARRPPSPRPPTPQPPSPFSPNATSPSPPLSPVPGLPPRNPVAAPPSTTSPASAKAPYSGRHRRRLSHHHRHHEHQDLHLHQDHGRDGYGVEDFGAASSHLNLHLTREGRKGAARSRSLYSPLKGDLATNYFSPYSCTLKGGGCKDGGPFVGIQCSHTIMQPAPPPPPSPPAPPPAPPAVSNFIRMYGYPLTVYTKVYGSVEPNLVDEAAMLGTLYGRFEVQVPVNGNLVWAPLCSPPLELAYTSGQIACQQVYDWPLPFDGGIAYVRPRISTKPFTIPQAASDPKDFDPSAYSAWATVVGPGSLADPRSLQQMELQVSSERCEKGTMLAVGCEVSGERRMS